VSFETDSWPFVRARWFTPIEGKRRDVRVIVIHDMEFPERKDSAEVIAHDFAHRPPDQKASAHLCIDNDSIIQCVRDNDVAFAAPGANNDGIQIELAGFGAQKAAEWLDLYGTQMLGLAADAVAQYCLKYNIPIRWLTDGELFKGERGIVGHVQVSHVYHKSDHTDPGPNFPWLHFLSMVVQAKRKVLTKRGLV
jgi:N-acetyl-anhydromuramyl-L-alanine amidase AmpD